jgi:hypothetical protein
VTPSFLMLSFIAADGVHEVLMTGGHGAARPLLLGRQPGQDPALQTG